MPAKSSIGASAVPLVASATPASRGVQLKAAAGNTGKVYVGYAATVTAGTADATDGVELSAGEGYLVPPSKLGSPPDAAAVYLIGSASGQKVYYDVL